MYKRQTQDKGLQRGLVVTDKAERVYHFHRNTLHAAIELLSACGRQQFTEVAMDMFVRGDEFVRMADHYFPDHLVNTLRQQVNTARAKEGAEPV